MDLNRASTFVRVVETGGFTRAAEALKLPPSSVSRSVARLEDELGVTLLERTTRKVALTDAGRAFFERARDALAGLEQANALALDAAREAHGVVRLAIVPDIAATIGGTLAPFLAEHPRIHIEITATTRGDELVGDVVDLAIVGGKLPDSSLLSRRLGISTNRLFAAPAYLERRGQPRGIAEVARHDGILLRGFGGAPARWELVGPRGPERIDVIARLVGDHLSLLFDAAIAGVGVALLPDAMAMRAVADGRLTAVLPRYAVEAPLYVLTAAGRHVPRRVALLREFLADKVPAQCKKHHG